MNCRDFLNEFEERNALTDAATWHLKDCADCQKTKAAQMRVWQLIDKFEPIAAPNDFNFRVKAKIAEAKPGDFRSASFPVLRYVLGLSVAGLIFAFVVVNGFYSFNNETVPQMAETNFQPPVQKENPLPAAPEQFVAQTVPSLETESPSEEISKPKTRSIANKKQSRNQADAQFAVAKAEKRQSIKAAQNIGTNPTTSNDLASKGARFITPNGLPNSAQATKNPSNFENVNPITAEQILLQLGIESVLENGQRKVKKITANSVAERSGIKVGDLVEAIDGEKLTSEPIRAKTIEGKKLAITRGKEKIEILLRN